MWHLLRNPPSLFGGWDSDRPRAVAAMFKGITGICDDKRHAIPGAGENPESIGGLGGGRPALSSVGSGCSPDSVSRHA